MASPDTLEMSREPGGPPLNSRFSQLFPLVLLGIVTAAAAVLRFHAIGWKPIWIDEGVSIEVARLDWYNFLRVLWRHEGNMTLYYVLRSEERRVGKEGRAGGVPSLRQKTRGGQGM